MREVLAMVGESIENMRVNGNPSQPLRLRQLPIPMRRTWPEFKYAPAKPESDGNDAKEEAIHVRA